MKKSKIQDNTVIIEKAVEGAKERLTAQIIAYGKERGLTDYALSKMCGFAQSQWIRITSGEVSINVTTLMRVAVGLNLKFVFDGRGSKGEILSVDLVSCVKGNKKGSK